MQSEELDDPFCDPNNPIAVSFNEITSASFRIKNGVIRTDCTQSGLMSKLTDMQLYLKKEFMQATGSFKERGARYALLMLPPNKRKKGIITASAGNHALACCYHGYDLGIPVTVVMPLVAPIMKIQKCITYHGNVIVEGELLEHSKAFALKYGKEHELTYIDGYDHPHIIAGQGTIGLEMWEQVPDLEAVIVPVGGGGIIAGVAVAIRALNKNCLIIGVEPERAQCLTRALAMGKPSHVDVGNTLADGLAVPRIGFNAFESVKNILHKVVTIKEEFIAIAILRLVEYEKAVVEGAGAAGLAAILSGQLDELKGKKVGLILSGGNIDTTILGRAIERGLVADGRLIMVKIIITDRPGSVSHLCSLINSVGVSIKNMYFERAWITNDILAVDVKVICESRNYEHGLELRDVLFDKYRALVFNHIVYPKSVKWSRSIMSQEKIKEISDKTSTIPECVCDVESES